MAKINQGNYFDWITIKQIVNKMRAMVRGKEDTGEIYKWAILITFTAILESFVLTSAW